MFIYSKIFFKLYIDAMLQILFFTTKLSYKIWKKEFKHFNYLSGEWTTYRVPIDIKKIAFCSLLTSGEVVRETSCYTKGPGSNAR